MTKKHSAPFLRPRINDKARDIHLNNHTFSLDYFLFNGHWDLFLETLLLPVLLEHLNRDAVEPVRLGKVEAVGELGDPARRVRFGRDELAKETCSREAGERAEVWQAGRSGMSQGWVAGSWWMRRKEKDRTERGLSVALTLQDATLCIPEGDHVPRSVEVRCGRRGVGKLAGSERAVVSGDARRRICRGDEQERRREGPSALNALLPRFCHTPLAHAAQSTRTGGATRCGTPAPPFGSARDLRLKQAAGRRCALTLVVVDSDRVGRLVSLFVPLEHHRYRQLVEPRARERDADVAAAGGHVGQASESSESAHAAE